MQLQCFWRSRSSSACFTHHRSPVWDNSNPLSPSIAIKAARRCTSDALGVANLSNYGSMMGKATRDIADGAVLVEFPQHGTERANEAAVRLWRQLSLRRPAGFLDAVVGARTLLVLFDPATFAPGALEGQDEETEAADLPVPRQVRIPVCYGGALGPDLEELARNAGLSVPQFTHRHAAATYRVAFIGFAPGFPYLTGLPPSLHAPRLPSPRARVPAGSVAIGGEYSGIYPSQSPGGWRLIGKAPISLFEPGASPPSLLAAGDQVFFEEISAAAFERLQREVIRHPPNRVPDGASAVMRVLSASLCTSIQGAPRYGWGAFGVPTGGAMDLGALWRANAALNNTPYAPGLETTLLGPRIECLRSARLCLEGGRAEPTLNGRAIAFERPFEVKPGDQLDLGPIRSGARSYLCIEGGWVDSSLPGEPLRRLGPGDELFVQTSTVPPAVVPRLPIDKLRAGSSGSTVQSSLQGVLRVVAGPQRDRFSPEGVRTLFSSEYRVASQSDRQGIRLEGPPIELEGPADISPEGTAPGAIQVPANGLPIILGPDRPVTGGYAKIATVIGADLPMLAQARPGTTLRFQEVSIADSLAAWGLRRAQ
jgi:KipI family sensor histidine kinase inhibitor